MASAEEKLKDESKDRQVMGSNANGADGTVLLSCVVQPTRKRAPFGGGRGKGGGFVTRNCVAART